jgi:hypothetical protein
MSLAPGTTAPQKTTCPKKATVDYMSAPLETNLTGNANNGLHNFDDEHQEKSSVYKGKNDQDTVRNPSAGSGTDGYLYGQR